MSPPLPRLGRFLGSPEAKLRRACLPPRPPRSWCLLLLSAMKTASAAGGRLRAAALLAQCLARVGTLADAPGVRRDGAAYRFLNNTLQFLS